MAPDSPSPAAITTGRLAAGLSPAQAAALVYCTPRAWQLWEAGSRSMPPGLWELFRLKTCGVPLPAI